MNWLPMGQLWRQLTGDPYRGSLASRQPRRGRLVDMMAIGVAMVAPLLVTTQTQAQTECYMQSASGQLIDLSRLCGTGTTPPRSSSPQSTSATSVTRGRVFQAAIKRRQGRLPIIEVTFNGGYRFEMIVDTGASGTLITADMAREMQLRPVGRIYVSTASEQDVPMDITVMNSIEVGGVAVRNVRVAVADSGLDVGLLGHDFFGDYDLTIKQDVVEFRLR